MLAACLGAAGVTLRLVAPFAWLERGLVPAAPLAAVLVALLIADAAQQPLLGRLARASGRRPRPAAWCAWAILAASTGALLAAPSGASLALFAVSSAGLAAARGILSIRLQAAGAAPYGSGGGGTMRLVAWRETGTYAGAVAGLALPAGLVVLRFPGDPFAGHAAVLAVATAAALAAMASDWVAGSPARGGARAILADPTARRLLLASAAIPSPLAAAPVLLLSLASIRLLAPGAAGMLLALSLVAAAAAVPLWRRFAMRVGLRRALVAAFALGAAAQAGAVALGAGDVVAFAALCLAGGAATGGQRALLLAAFARALDRAALDACDGFALRACADRLCGAAAVIFAWPMLGAAGVAIGQPEEGASVWIGAVLVAALAAAGVAAALRPVRFGQRGR